MSTTTQATAVTTIKHFINGAETTGDSSNTQPVYNPATGEVTANLALASARDLEATVVAARAAADSWGTPPSPSAPPCSLSSANCWPPTPTSWPAS